MNRITQLAAKSPAFALTVWKFTRPRVQMFWKYAKVELRPPNMADIPAIRKTFQDMAASAQSGKFLQLSVKEAWLNTLIAAEIILIFFVGECIGKRKLIGYYVPP